MITRREIVTNYAILTFFAAFALAPIVGILIMGLTPARESSATFIIPSHLDFGNFSQAWGQGQFSLYMRSSALVSVITVVVAAVISILAGYAFAELRFRGRSLLFYILLLGFLVPVETYIIPLYYEMESLHLLNTYTSLILPQVAQSVAFGTFWMRTFFAAVPRSLIEAAELDGAPRRIILWRVLVPAGRPAVVSMLMLTFMWTWNGFMLPLVMITSNDRRTAPLALSFFQGVHLTQYSLLAAAAVIVAAPVVLLYVFLQRYFIQGMLQGAVKG